MTLEATTLSYTLLLKFALGYFAILATPGPNMLTIGTMAALRGFRGALPFCLGVALGAGLVAGATSLLLEAFAGSHRLEMVGRVVAGTLLMALAFRIICARAPRLSNQSLFSEPQMLNNWAVGLGTGFFIALTNPVTAAYCFAQFIGPLAQSNVAPWVILLVATQALLFGLLIAALFAHPFVRHVAFTYHRQVCAISGLMLHSLGLLMLLPVAL
ncbi:MAG: LysE family transporter [Roseomonas sp.]|nr:LysE family transporter [Roseomonas sp.]MCA3428657.1 LysE family transporter [Roseomonas sp.]MCA3435341.1 LysE family transporter [Roseomonas sp.]